MASFGLDFLLHFATVNGIPSTTGHSASAVLAATGGASILGGLRWSEHHHAGLQIGQRFWGVDATKQIVSNSAETSKIWRGCNIIWGTVFKIGTRTWESKRSNYPTLTRKRFSAGVIGQNMTWYDLYWTSSRLISRTHILRILMNTKQKDVPTRSRRSTSSVSLRATFPAADGSTSLSPHIMTQEPHTMTRYA